VKIARFLVASALVFAPVVPAAAAGNPPSSAVMARGIPEVEAEALLVQAFIGEAVEGIEHAGLRDALMEQVVAWLRARGG